MRLTFSLLPGQVEWRDEVRHHFEKIKSEGTCLHRLDEELIKRRREELRSAKNSSLDYGHANMFMVVVQTRIHVHDLHTDMHWTSESTMRGSSREPTISTWNSTPSCCSWRLKRRSCSSKETVAFICSSIQSNTQIEVGNLGEARQHDEL